MRRFFIAAAAGVLSLALAGPAAAATVPVTSLSGDFEATNPSVALTLDGVQFGPYADGGAAGGSVLYTGFNGKTLADLNSLGYTARYNTTDDTTVGVPYLRVYLENDTHDVIFSPNTQPAAQQKVDENVDNSYDVVGGTVRYDDDPGNGPDSPWADIVAAHGNEVVSGIYVSAGFSAGADLSALLRNLTVNGDTFCFNCSPIAGQGATGGTGATGATGATGPTGPSTNQAVSGPIPVRILGGRINRKRGVVRLRLRCPAAAGLCDGSVRLRLRSGRRLARRSFDADGGRTVRLRIRLSRSARKALGSRRIRVSVLSRDQRGLASRVSRTIR